VERATEYKPPTRFLLGASPSGCALLNRFGPVLCQRSPSPPVPSGTGPLTAVDPPLRTRSSSARAEQPGGEVRTLFGSVRRALDTGPRRTSWTL